MMRHALEKGIASIIAKFLLESRHDAVFTSIARANALPPEEIEKLRVDTLAYLGKVEKDGAPYAQTVKSALKEVGVTVAEMNPAFIAAGGIAARTARSAVKHAVSQYGGTAEAAGAAARHAAAHVASMIPNPPPGKADVSAAPAASNEPSTANAPHAPCPSPADTADPDT